MGWCGSFSTGFWEHGTFAPCKTETIAGFVVLVAAAVIFFAQYYRIRTVVTRRHVPVLEAPGKQLLSSSVYGTLAASHAAWLLYMALGPHANFAAFDFTFQLVLLVIWMGSLVSLQLDRHNCCCALQSKLVLNNLQQLSMQLPEAVP